MHVATLTEAWIGDRAILLISGAPAANWWVLAVYMLVGLIVLALNSRRVRNPRARRGVALVLFGVDLRAAAVSASSRWPFPRSCTPRSSSSTASAR